ncbi:MAG: ribonuclease J [Microthrixaceae bacterium]
MSALALLGSGDNKWLRVTPEDTVILSSHPIPGNESAVSRVIDNLTRLGAQVVHSGIEDVHATGHAKQEELKLFLSVARPEWFVPVHGEYRHLVAHSRLATTMGVAEDHVVVAEDGHQLELSDDGLRRVGSVPSDYVFVHGRGDVDSETLQQRRILGAEGVVTAIVCVDLRRRRLVGGPEVASRGWVAPDSHDDFVDGIATRVRAAVDELLASGDELGRPAIERAVRRAAGSYVGDATRRRPMIVPVVLLA